MSLLSFLSIISLVQSATFSGSDIRVSLTYNNGCHRGSSYVIPVEYRINEGVDMIYGYARFAPELILESAQSTIGRLHEGITTMADLVVIRDEFTNLSAFLNISEIVPVSIDSTLWSHSAVFVRSKDFRSFVVFFDDRVNGSLILAPSDPRQFAYNRELFYTSLVDDSTLDFGISVTVVSDANSNSTSNRFPIYRARASLDTGREFSIIPERMMEVLIDAIGRVATVHDRFVTLHNPDDIDRLPILRFRPLGEGVAVNMDMLPSEYMHLVGPGLRYELSVGGRGSSSCVLGHNFLNMVVIHADYENNRIGFGEPLEQVVRT